MEVGKIESGAWLTLYPLDEKIGEVKLRLRPIPSDFQLPDDADAKASIDVIASFITGWNLEIDGVAVPCNEDTKAKYVGFLFRLEVKGEKEGASEFAALAIMRFAADIDNFLKN